MSAALGGLLVWQAIGFYWILYPKRETLSVTSVKEKKNAKEEGSATPDAFSPGFFADFCRVDDPAHCKMHD